MLEQGPRGDGQAHGRAERAVRSIEELVRLQLTDFEERITQWREGKGLSESDLAAMLAYARMPCYDGGDALVDTMIDMMDERLSMREVRRCWS